MRPGHKGPRRQALQEPGAPPAWPHQLQPQPQLRHLLLLLPQPVALQDQVQVLSGDAVGCATGMPTGGGAGHLPAVPLARRHCSSSGSSSHPILPALHVHANHRPQRAPGARLTRYLGTKGRTRQAPASHPAPPPCHLPPAGPLLTCTPLLLCACPHLCPLPEPTTPAAFLPPGKRSLAPPPRKRGATCSLYCSMASSRAARKSRFSSSRRATWLCRASSAPSSSCGAGSRASGPGAGRTSLSVPGTQGALHLPHQGPPSPALLRSKPSLRPLCQPFGPPVVTIDPFLN